MSGGIRAVLFDVGGPIDTEVMHEQQTDKVIRETLIAQGVEVSEADLAAASGFAVASFAPNAYATMAWKLSGESVPVTRAVLAALEASSDARREARGRLEMRPGVPEMLATLAGRGLLLGLAANQPARVVADLDGFGAGQYFSHREVSGHHGYRKPDVRLFLRACEDLGVEPRECIMVGDRIDNDIAPANLLGMGTVLLRTGRHIGQQARHFDELPMREASDTASMLAAVIELAEMAR